MTDSIAKGSKAEKACPDALPHDEPGSWAKTVITSLPTRSRAEKTALLKALLDGENDDLTTTIKRLNLNRSGRTILR